MTRESGRLFVGAILALALHGSFMPRTAAAAELDSNVQQQIRAATFEVLQLKPPEGDVVYERPLPMELMPYRQRTDAYRPIGTAFAIAPDRYVSAAHVIGSGAGSQFGPPALRDEAGQVYAIAQVIKYSAREDFVVFKAPGRWAPGIHRPCSWSTMDS
jgi:serine protease Do